MLPDRRDRREQSLWRAGRSSVFGVVRVLM